MNRIRYVDYVTGMEILTVMIHQLPLKSDKVIIDDINYYVDGNKTFNYDDDFIIVKLRKN